MGAAAAWQAGHALTERVLRHACAAQIIQEADKIYGVAHSNRVSRIECVTREDALEFVRANLQEAQAEAADGDEPDGDMQD